MWIQQFYFELGSIRWRESSNCPPPAILINSPYDPDARRGNKRTRQWTGYKIHLSETCDEDAPHLITYVETMASTTKDHQVMENLHQTLKSQELLPEKHLVDAGYIDTELLVTSAENFQVDLIGPAPSDSHWQARAGVEGTISQATRAFGLRRCRYRGFPKTRLQHIITAAAINLVRVWEWWTGANVFGRRLSRFATLDPNIN